MDFTHFDENGNAIMIDVSSKDIIVLSKQKK